MRTTLRLSVVSIIVFLQMAEVLFLFGAGLTLFGLWWLNAPLALVFGGVLLMVFGILRAWKR